MPLAPYSADRSLRGKLRRHGSRLLHRRPAPRPERAMISFSFDDAPVSAFTTGAAILERHGVRATFFVCGGTLGETGAVGLLGEAEHARRAHEAGHEMGCHTFSHMDCGRADPLALGEDLERNRTAFESWGVPAPVSFAYPYGEVGAAAKRRLARTFSVSRAVHAGLVAPGGDLAQAPAVGAEGEQGEARAEHWIEEAARRGGWLILFTHGVEESVTPYGCTAEALERLVLRARARGLEPVTVAEGARRLSA